MTARANPPQVPFSFPPTQTARRSSRRQFLKNAGLAGAAAPLILLGLAQGASPNAKLNHACIGVGGMGMPDLENFLSHKQTQVVALCDVDANHLARAKE